MKIPSKLEVWTARFEQASRVPVGDTGAVKHDLAKMKAADGLQALAATRAADAETAGPLDRAKRLWAERGRDGIPELAERVVVDGPGEDFQALLAGADAATLSKAVDELALRVVMLDGEEAALSRLLDLKVVCDAGRDLVPEYNRRIRSTPRPQRSAELPPGLEETLDQLQVRLRDVRDELHAGTFMGRVQAKAGAVSDAMLGASRNLLERFKGDPEDRGFFSAVWDKTKWLGRQLVPASVHRALSKITASASDLISAVDGVEKDVDDHDRLVERLCQGMAAASATLDPEADAIAVGLMGETTAGVTAGSGHELVYLREESKLRLNRLDATGARIGVGGSLRAFTSNLYGEPEELSGSTGRNALELGAVVANLSFNRGRAGGKRGSRSFSTIFSAGVVLSVPFLDGQAVTTVSERNLSTFDLNHEQVMKLEKALDQVGPSARRWTGLLGRMVRKGKVPEPGSPS